MIRKTYKYRLYPTRAQVASLDATLALCCELYNAALQERRDAWRINRASINYNQQSAQLVEIKQIRTEYTGVYAQVLQDALRRVDKTFQAFFSRVKRKVKAGFPRFRALSRYDSFTYPQGGFALEGSKLTLSKIGKVKIKLHRLIEGKIKTCTVKRECGRWYVCFSVECEDKTLLPSSESIGIDVGLSVFATLSDGTEIENPRYFEKAQAKLRKAQRRVSRKKKGSTRRRKAVQRLARINAHIRQQRADFHHKVSRALVNNYGLIAVEDLNVKGLASGMLAKQVNDAGWSAFMDKIAYKAESAGRVLLRVNPRGTSQRCVCGALVSKTLAQRRHNCTACGLSASRDHASALEILRLGLSLQSVTCSGS
jgi:putative transposase